MAGSNKNNCFQIRIYDSIIRDLEEQQQQPPPAAKCQQQPHHPQQQGETPLIGTPLITLPMCPCLDLLSAQKRKGAAPVGNGVG
ncbi:hypothetical protein TKK_0013836 [Trichogramma kaykai]